MPKFLRYLPLLILVALAPALRADSCLDDLTRPSLVRTALLANVLVPQATNGINLMVFTLVLNHPELIPELFAKTTKAEIETAERMMNRAHAAYHIRYRSAGHPDATPEATVKQGRLAALIRTSRVSTLQSLLYVAHGLEPQGRRWLTRSAYGINETAHEHGGEEGRMIAAALQALLKRHGHEDSQSLLFAYRTALARVVEGQDFKSFNRRYREDVSSTIQRFGRRQRDQARWEHEVDTFLKTDLQKKIEELLPPEKLGEIYFMSAWNAGD